MLLFPFFYLAANCFFRLSFSVVLPCAPHAVGKPRGIRCPNVQCQGIRGRLAVAIPAGGAGDVPAGRAAGAVFACRVFGYKYCAAVGALFQHSRYCHLPRLSSWAFLYPHICHVELDAQRRFVAGIAENAIVVRCSVHLPHLSLMLSVSSRRAIIVAGGKGVIINAYLSSLRFRCWF